jgi:dihydroorotase
MSDRITFTRPDDWHAHFRDGEAMASVVGATARQFARAIAMPNLKPPVTTTEQARGISRSHREGARGPDFEPLMTLYLTDKHAGLGDRARRGVGVREGGEVLPAGATTNSDSGVTDLRKCDAVFEAMAAAGHAAARCTARSRIRMSDLFDREAVFMERSLAPLVKRFPEAQDRRRACDHAGGRWRSSSARERTSPPRSPRTTS